jgi:hypothetical protein
LTDCDKYEAEDWFRRIIPFLQMAQTKLIGFASADENKPNWYKALGHMIREDEGEPFFSII